jgi:protein-L-isoaspartate(D-aspartate) O-methyltransferase
MRTVPRHEFLPMRLRGEAYMDYPLPIGHGQTISQPFIVAFMTEAIRPQPGEKILEIGAGSGYQAAVLAQMGADVYTVEIVEPLAEMAQQTLERLGFNNAHVRHGDGFRGWPEHAPFDAIIVTCAPDKIPPDLVAQLRDGGRMIIPVGGGMEQELVLLRKEGGKIEKQSVLPVRFVPMTGEAQDAR